MKLGGGRATKEDDIDPNVGIVLHKKIGERVEKGEVLADIYANSQVSQEILELLEEAYEIVPEEVHLTPIIHEIIS